MKNLLRLSVMTGLLAISGCDRADEPPVVSTTKAAPAQSATGPVVALIDGERVEGFKAWYENGILTLYTGRDPHFDYGHKISFWHLPHEPDGQQIRYPAPEGSTQFGQMTYARQDLAVNSSTEWLKEFQYDLKLGREADFLVKVTLVSRANGPVDLQVSGEVVAMTAGIKMTDGIVDRGFDHLDTIQWLTRSWISDRYQPKAIADRPDHCMMENAPKKKPSKPRRQVAACSFLFTDETNKLAVAKLWLEKLDGQWKEVGEIEPEQLFRAHPIKPPRDRPPYVFTSMAAQRFESKVYARQGSYMRISEPGAFSCGGGQKEGQSGWCEIQYPIYPKDRTLGENDSPFCQVTTYVFDKNADGEWGISKTLSTAQKFNRKTQTVEPRDSVPAHCG